MLAGLSLLSLALTLHLITDALDRAVSAGSASAPETGGKPCAEPREGIQAGLGLDVQARPRVACGRPWKGRFSVGPTQAL